MQVWIAYYEADARIIGRTIGRPWCGTRTRDTRIHWSFFCGDRVTTIDIPREGKAREPGEEIESKCSHRMKEDLLQWPKSRFGNQHKLPEMRVLLFVIFLKSRASFFIYLASQEKNSFFFLFLNFLFKILLVTSYWRTRSKAVFRALLRLIREWEWEKR